MTVVGKLHIGWRFFPVGNWEPGKDPKEDRKNPRASIASRPSCRRLVRRPMERQWCVHAAVYVLTNDSVRMAHSKSPCLDVQNSANSREATMPSGSSPDAGGADSRAGRIPPVMGQQMASMAPSRLAQASFPTVRMEGTSVRGNNLISLDMTARKRSLEALSPLPSPLLTFLSPSLASSSSASALSLPNTMNQYDLSSSRPQKMNPVGSLQAMAVGNNSLKFVVPSGVKRVRRDAPSSPCSVGEVTANAAGSTSAGPSPSPALRPVVPPPPASSDKIRSVVRGLEHVSRCSPSGCGNPLCVSTRGFMNKVSAHLVAMANKPGHVAERCGACQLWHSIVRSHASICMEVDCSIPLCSSANEKPDGGAVESSSSGCRPRDRRDDNDDQRRSLVAQQ